LLKCFFRRSTWATVQIIGRKRRTQLHDDLGNRSRYLELKKEAEDHKWWKDSLSIKHKEGIQDIFLKTMDLLVSIIITIIIVIIMKSRNILG
jgi:hypothetical protein